MDVVERKRFDQRRPARLPRNLTQGNGIGGEAFCWCCKGGRRLKLLMW